MAVIIFPIFPEFQGRILAAIIFSLTALTDMLDGHIARKYNMITNFGKFLDPVADKLMVIGAFIALMTTIKDRTFLLVFAWAAFIVIVREISVTSLRMIASSTSEVVIAANSLGKIKTCSQIACVLVVLLEPAFFGGTFFDEHHILSYITIIFMTIMTLWSGINYLKAYWPLLNVNK